MAALVKSPKQRKRKLVPWSSEEARRFLESPRSDDDPLYAAYVMVLVLGLRKGEVLGLIWSSANPDLTTMVVDHQLQRVGRALLHRETKTEASDADLPMPPLVAAALSLRRDRQEKERVAAEDAWLGLPEGPHFMFTGRYGMPVEPRTLNRAFTARCAKAGVRHMTVHDARSDLRDVLVDLDIHRRIIMRILRHADVVVTMEIYAQASSDATREALRRLGGASNERPWLYFAAVRPDPGERSIRRNAADLRKRWLG